MIEEYGRAAAADRVRCPEQFEGDHVVLFFLKRRFLILNKEQQHEKTIVNLTFRYDIPFVDHCILQFNPTMSSKEDKKAGQSQIT